MDVYCERCGEPHEVECLAEPDEYGLTLAGKRIVACGACEWHAAQGFPLRDAAEIAGIAADLMGDDIDGIAAMMDDARAMGLI